MIWGSLGAVAITLVSAILCTVATVVAWAEYREDIRYRRLLVRMFWWVVLTVITFVTGYQVLFALANLALLALKIMPTY